MHTSFCEVVPRATFLYSSFYNLSLLLLLTQQGVQGTVVLMMNIRNVGSKESLRVKLKDGIGTKLCLKLWFKSDWYSCNITDSWFWKQLSRNKVPNNHLLKSVWKSNFRSPLRTNGQLFPIKWLIISYPMHGSIKLVIINMAYTSSESYPLSY